MSKFVLLHSPAWDRGGAAAALDAEQIECRAITGVAAGLLDDRPTVLLLDEALRRLLGSVGVRAVADAGATVVALERRARPICPPSSPASSWAPSF